MSAHDQRRGFTVLELMVVLVLLAITAAAAVPAFLGSSTLSTERRAATAVAEVLVHARDIARETGAPSTLVLAPADGRFWLTTRDSIATDVLPLAGATLTAETGHDRLQCRFEPKGPATPCAITVHGAQRLTVRVNGWTGEITIDDGRPR